MTTPNIPELEPFLTSLTFQKPSSPGVYDSEIIADFGLAGGVDKKGRPIDLVTPKVLVWYKSIGGFTIKSLISIVESNLKRKGHLSNKRIALAVIALYLNLRQPTEQSSSFLFEVLENTTPASATLFYIYPRFTSISPETRILPFQFGPYSFGELDMAKMRRLCKTAKSDYYDRYEHNLMHRWAIQREFPEVNLINWWPYREQRLPAFSIIQPLGNLYNELAENYFDQMNLALFERFFSGILEEQLLTISVGDTYLDERALEMLPITDKVAIFQNTDGKNGNGFVKPLTTPGYYMMDLKAVDTHLPQTIERLKKEFNLAGLTDIPIHQTVRTFARFVAKAKKYKWDDSLDDAFVHFIIALDLIFGKSDKSVAPVSKRTAAITYQKAKVKFDRQVDRIRDLYDERSKYVHRGQSPNTNLICEAESICDEVLLCLLRLQKNEQQRPLVNVDNWIKNLDLIAAILEAGKTPDSDLFAECGISSE